jgi:hypothetical protein
MGHLIVWYDSLEGGSAMLLSLPRQDMHRAELHTAIREFRWSELVRYNT